MPINYINNHIKLINDLLQYEDISTEILQHIDINEMDKKKSYTEHKRRWKRNKNIYDSLKYRQIRR